MKPLNGPTRYQSRDPQGLRYLYRNQGVQGKHLTEYQSLVIHPFLNTKTNEIFQSTRNTTDLGAITINLLSLSKHVMNLYLITYLNIINYPYLNIGRTI